MKTCTKCRVEKPLSHFGRDARSKSGLRGHCRPCNASYAKSWAERNPDKQKENQKRHYAANKQRIIQNTKEWAKNNPEKYRISRQKIREKNKVKYKQMIKEWRINNREASRAILQRRRAVLKNNGVFSVSKKELIKLYKSPCVYCGSKNQITIDHIIPICKGGTHSIGNLTSACKSCNSSKNKDFLTVWKKKQKIYQIAIDKDKK